MEHPDPGPRLLEQAGAAVAEGAVEDQAGAQLGLRVRALVRERDGALDHAARAAGPGT